MNGNYCGRPLRRNRPTLPTDTAQAPRITMTTEEGSRTGWWNEAALVAWAATAAWLAHTQIIINFMNAILRGKHGFINKLPAQISTARTTATRGSSHHGVKASWYHGATVLALSFAGVCAFAQPQLVDLELPAHFDPFAMEAEVQYNTAAEAACAVPKPVGFIGYRWRLPAIAAELRRMSGASPGKQIYVAFLKSKYGYQISQVNADYGTDAQSFTELLESPIKRGIPQHDAEFEAPLRREMLEAILAALRKCDAMHADALLRLFAGGE